MSVPAKVSMERAQLLAIAMDIGKQVVAHLEHSHAEWVAQAASWPSKEISIRNATANAVMHAIDMASKGLEGKMIAENAAHRREMRRLRKLSDAAQDYRLSKLRVVNK